MKLYLTRTKDMKNNNKEYLAEQVGLLWMLTGPAIEGAEIYTKLTDIPSRFFDSIKIIPQELK